MHRWNTWTGIKVMQLVDYIPRRVLFQVSRIAIRQSGNQAFPLHRMLEVGTWGVWTVNKLGPSYSTLRGVGLVQDSSREILSRPGPVLRTKLCETILILHRPVKSAVWHVPRHSLRCTTLALALARGVPNEWRGHLWCWHLACLITLIAELEARYFGCGIFRAIETSHLRKPWDQLGSHGHFVWVIQLVTCQTMRILTKVALRFSEGLPGAHMDVAVCPPEARGPVDHVANPLAWTLAQVPSFLSHVSDSTKPLWEFRQLL